MTRSASRRARAAEEKARRKAERQLITLEFDYEPGFPRYQGPVIITDLTITDAQREAHEKAGQAVPSPVRCRFLVDTGADGTVVKHEFAERAGLKLISDNLSIHGVGVDTTGRAYMGRIVFRAPSRVVERGTHTIAVDTQVMGAKLESDLLDGLIGRDVLHHFQLMYDGKTGAVRMRYHRPEKPS